MKECFGTIFPDTRRIEYNREYQGKVFSVIVNHQPIAVKSETIKSNQEAWQKCFNCECYQSCYDFSMAKLQFNAAVKSSC
jgi:Rieske Fe-S protein